MQLKPIAGLMVAAVISLLATGCGGTSQQLPVASIGNTNPDGTQHLQPASASQAAAALRASRCMRTHGVPNFPDPILGGHFGFTVNSGIDPDAPQFKKAYSYCGHRYLPGFDSATPAERAQWNAAAVKYAACMRSHGASDFPDPDGRGAIDVPTSDYLNTPKVARAQSACKSLFTGKGVVFVVPFPRSAVNGTAP